jgi:pimeloyl-ACP methyl ester carboxylesterase
MSSRTVSIDPPELGFVDGLAWALFRADGRTGGGVVVLHGADSAKESHYGFARACRAAGVNAICFDARGHGESEGILGRGALEDVRTIASLLPAGPVALRGSSMGGFLALAAAPLVRPDAVVAICPASADGLLRGLRAGRLRFGCDRPGLEALLGGADAEGAAAGLGGRLLLLHAEGDDVVPVERSRALHAMAPGSRLVTVPGGHHRTVQHDPDLEALSVGWVRRALRDG